MRPVFIAVAPRALAAREVCTDTAVSPPILQVISEYTNRDIKDVFVTRELDTVAVKGKEDGVKIYELVAVRHQPRSDRPGW